MVMILILPLKVYTLKERAHLLLFQEVFQALMAMIHKENPQIHKKSALVCPTAFCQTRNSVNPAN